MTTRDLFAAARPSLIGAGLLFVLSGCVKSLNSKVPVIQPEPIAAQPASADELSHRTEPIVVSPVAGEVEHRPVYVTHLEWADGHPRSGGEFPSIDTVVAEPRNDRETALEGVVAIPWAAWQIIYAPVQVISGRLPLDVETSPESGYERAPSSSLRDVDDWFGVRPVPPGE